MNEAAAPRLRELWIRLLLYPGHTLPTAAAPVLVGTGLAVRDGVFAPAPLVLALLGSWLLHTGGVLTDNHELLRRHADLPEHPELLAALDRGALRLAHLRLAALLCMLLGALPAPWLFARGGWPVLAIGALGLVASYGYFGRGIAYARHGLADPMFLLLFGVVAPASVWWIQAAPAVAVTDVPLAVWIAGLPSAALVVCVLVIDDVRDREFDRRKGWRTTAVRFGVRGSRIEFTALLAFAYFGPLALWLGLGMSPAVLLCWLSLPGALAVRGALQRHDTTEMLRPMTPRMARVAAAHAALFAIGVAL
ncbi:MAG: prenyltransferase [Planctomycetota bacterium]